MNDEMGTKTSSKRGPLMKALFIGFVVGVALILTAKFVSLAMT